MHGEFYVKICPSIVNQSKINLYKQMKTQTNFVENRKETMYWRSQL